MPKYGPVFSGNNKKITQWDFFSSYTESILNPESFSCSESFSARVQFSFKVGFVY